MQKYLVASLFCVLLAVSLFDPRVAGTVREPVELVKGAGANAHGCPKGQVFQKHTKSCVPKAK